MEVFILGQRLREQQLEVVTACKKKEFMGVAKTGCGPWERQLRAVKKEMGSPGFKS